MKSNHGFTLVEIMISISILSLLLFTGSYVYRTISIHWDRELGQFSENFSQARSFNLLNEIISGAAPLVLVNSEGNTSVPAMFFVGGNDSLLSLTKTGVIYPENAEIFRLTTVRNSQGKLDLVYQSVAFRDNLILQTQTQINFKHKLTLLTDLDDVVFRYFGWENFNVKKADIEQNAIRQKNWFSSYSGVDRQLMPEKVEVIVEKAGKSMRIQIELDPNSDRHLTHFYSQMDDA